MGCFVGLACKLYNGLMLLMATKKDTEKNKQQNDSAEQKHSQTTSNKVVADDAQSDNNVKQEIDELLQTLDQNIGDIDPEEALSLIDHWYGFLNKVKEPEVKELASSLKELQKMLKGGKATGQEISEALIHLGEQTSEFSGNADKGLKQPVQRLGKQLRKAGTSIAQAEEQEYHQQLDSLLEKAENDELTSIDSETAIASIDFWYDLLSKAEGEQFQSIANSLKELKQAIKRGNAKPTTIAKHLTQLGEYASEVASESPRGFKGIIQKLGKQLAQAGESLTNSDAKAEVD